jgi:hypothetical protein
MKNVNVVSKKEKLVMNVCVWSLASVAIAGALFILAQVIIQGDKIKIY